MNDRTRSDRIVTPEAVALSLPAAGLGSRMIASIIDGAIQVGVLALAGIAAGGIWATGLFPAAWLGIGFLGVALVVLLGYFPLFEGLWNGQTPGKRAQRLRVVQRDGRPVTALPVLVRNLVRIVDFLPTLYGVGVVVVVLTSRSQRLGDLAAGTLVVREAPAPRPAPLVLAEGGPAAEAAAWLDTTRLTDREYALIRAFLERRLSLDRHARVDLARRVAEAVRPKLGGPVAEYGDEVLLEAAARSYRSRHSGA